MTRISLAMNPIAIAPDISIRSLEIMRAAYQIGSSFPNSVKLNVIMAESINALSASGSRNVPRRLHWFKRLAI